MRSLPGVSPHFREEPVHSFVAFPAGSLKWRHLQGPAPRPRSGGVQLRGDIHHWCIFLPDSDSIIHFFDSIFSCGLQICVSGYNSTWLSHKNEYLKFRMTSAKLTRFQHFPGQCLGPLSCQLQKPKDLGFSLTFPSPSPAEIQLGTWQCLSLCPCPPSHTATSSIQMLPLAGTLCCLRAVSCLVLCPSALPPSNIWNYSFQLQVGSGYSQA